MTVSFVTPPTALLEQIDAQAALSFWEGAQERTRAACGLREVIRGGGAAVVASGVNVLSFNRIVGMGVQAAATKHDLEEFAQAFADAGSLRHFVQLAPDAQPDTIPAWLVARRYAPYNHWVKLWRDAGQLPSLAADVSVEEIGEDAAERFAEICATAFGFPEVTRTWVSEVVARPRWRHYLARLDGEPAGVAAMFEGDDACWLGLAGTRSDLRGRGVQSALIARRLRDGAATGRRWFITESADDRNGEPSPSCRNMLRVGFRIAYRRPNWIFER